MSKEEKRQLRAEQQRVKENIEERQRRAREKDARRLEKTIAANDRKLAAQIEPARIDLDGPVNVACLIHGTGYSWNYVERLYSMVMRNITRPVRFHVYTEASREVPPHMIKHVLQEWSGVSGPRKSWWYKMQLFNSDLFKGSLLYFDLDVVIVGSLDWIPLMHPKFFWAPKDFRSMWRATHTGINSSVMWFDTQAFSYIWQDFKTRDLTHTIQKFQGDQDFVSEVVDKRLLRYFPPNNAISWRWQAKDGGVNFKNRLYLSPGTGTRFTNITSILIFHGSPKPHEVDDPVIQNFWR